MKRIMHYSEEISLSGRNNVFGHIQQALSQDLKVEPLPKVSVQTSNTIILNHGSVCTR